MLTDVENDTGGQVVAGSNPVSPTRKLAGEGRFRRNPRSPRLHSKVAVPYANAYANQDSLSTDRDPGVFDIFPPKSCDEAVRFE